MPSVDRFSLHMLLLLRVLTIILAASCTFATSPETLPPSPALAARHHYAADRAERLLRQLTLEEKIGQMSTSAPAVMRGGHTLIPAFNFWQEALHGMKVDDPDEPGGTLFPQVGGGGDGH